METKSTAAAAMVDECFALDTAEAPHVGRDGVVGGSKIRRLAESVYNFLVSENTYQSVLNILNASSSVRKCLKTLLEAKTSRSTPKALQSTECVSALRVAQDTWEPSRE